MDSAREFTNFVNDSDELGDQIFNNHSQNSQTSGSSTEFSMMTESISSPPESSHTSDIGADYTSTENSMLSNGTYDGSGETSDDSFEVTENLTTVAAAMNETSEQSSELSQESYGPAEAAAAAVAAAEISGSASEASQRTQDEFPEISQLETLFELFETCPLTEEQKDNLYDQLLQGLVEDRRKLREMEINYERRERFIKEFEAARKAADQAKINVRQPEPIGFAVIHTDLDGAEAGPSASPPKKKNLKTEKEGHAPENANAENASHQTGNADQAPQKGRGKRARPASEKEDANGKKAAPTPKTDNPRPEEADPVPQTANPNAAEVIPVTAEEHVSFQGAASEFERENRSSEESSDVEETLNHNLRVTPIYPSTKIVIPGPDNSSYDIEVSIQPDIRGIHRPGANPNETSNEPAIVRCVIPQIRFVVEEISPETLEEHLNRNVNPNPDSNDEDVPQQPPKSP